MSNNSRHDRIFNCHAHIFPRDHVPPFLAKCFVIWPFYYIFHLPTILKLFKFFNNIIDEQRVKANSVYNKLKRVNYRVYIMFREFLLLRIAWLVLASWLTIHAVFIINSKKENLSNIFAIWRRFTRK